MIEYTFNEDTIGFEDIAGITYWIYLNSERTTWDLIVEYPEWTFLLWNGKQGPYLTETQENKTISEELAFQIYEIIKQN
jgi:hypothetical protein